LTEIPVKLTENVVKLTETAIKLIEIPVQEQFDRATRVRINECATASNVSMFGIYV
jgi:hypothetical protein